jgi:type IV pilus assembly protein PilV
MKHRSSIKGVCAPYRGKQQGSTLIEVLIALMILSFMMLGVASAQLVSISSTRDANMRSLAALSADSLAALIHSNKVFWENLDTGFDLTISVADDEDGGIVPDYSSTVDLGDYGLVFSESGCDFDAGGCAPGDIALTDLRHWAEGWVTTVFKANAVIENVAAAGETPEFRITLGWRQKQFAETGDVADAAVLTNVYAALVKL